jgi:hypothetical protein
VDSIQKQSLDIPFELIDLSHPYFSSTVNSVRNLVQQRRAERIVATIIREIDGSDPVGNHGIHQGLYVGRIRGRIVYQYAALGHIAVRKGVDGRLARVICINVLEFDDGVGVIEVLGRGHRARVEDDICRVGRDFVVGIISGTTHVGVVRVYRVVDGVVEEDSVHGDVSVGVLGPFGIDVDVGFDVC